MYYVGSLTIVNVGRASEVIYRIIPYVKSLYCGDMNVVLHVAVVMRLMHDGHLLDNEFSCALILNFHCVCVVFGLVIFIAMSAVCSLII